MDAEKGRQEEPGNSIGRNPGGRPSQGPREVYNVELQKRGSEQPRRDPEKPRTGAHKTLWQESQGRPQDTQAHGRIQGVGPDECHAAVKAVAEAQPVERLTKEPRRVGREPQTPGPEAREGEPTGEDAGSGDPKDGTQAREVSRTRASWVPHSRRGGGRSPIRGEE